LDSLTLNVSALMLLVGQQEGHPRLSFWSVAQIICIWSSWCHCHPIIIKIQNGLPFFWCQLTQIVLEKRPL